MIRLRHTQVNTRKPTFGRTYGRTDRRRVNNAPGAKMLILSFIWSVSYRYYSWWRLPWLADHYEAKW